ncbi:MAG TPA: ABC transporter permease [Gemmatimonadaceae bacterium]|nr:ABC transporter permease [Gemmatimonadaceae bacterium]
MSAVSLRELVLVRFKEYYREPEAIFWSFVFPIILAIGLGIAFRDRPPEAVPVGLVTNAVTSVSSDSLAAHLQRGGGMTVTRVASEDGGRELLRTGRVALLVVPNDSAVTYVLDETRPEARLARLLADDRLQRGAGRADPVAIGERQVREPGSRYIDFLIPGLLGMNIMGGGMWGIGFSIVDARRKHLLKRLVATPMSRLEYLLSFVLSRLVFLVLEMAVVLGFAMLAFDVPVRGSIVQLGAIALVASLSFAALALLVVSRARTIEAASGLMNVAMLPQWVLSGVFFSSANFPDAAQPIIRALPLTATIDAFRATMLQGAGPSAVTPQLLVLAAWMIVSLALAMRMFRWR